MTQERNPPRKLDLGHAALDREHQGQLEHTDALERAIQAGASAPEVARLTEDLIQYLEAHFASEQIAMRESAYPAYEEHVHEHDEAIALVREFQKSSREQSLQALQVLRERLHRHVHTTDATLAEFLKRGP